MQRPSAEYQKSTVIRAVSITDADLEELRRIVAEGVRTDESLDLTIDAVEGDKTINATSIAGFVEQLDGTDVLDSLNIRFSVCAESGSFASTKYVFVKLSRNSVIGSDVYVSSADQTWCYGKSQVLARYFRSKRLWYWSMTGERLPWVLSAILFTQLSILTYSLSSHGNIVGTLASGLSSAVSIIIYWLAARAVMFPGFIFSRVAASKPSLMMNQAFSSAVGAIAAVVTAVAAVVTVVVLGLLR